MPAPTLGVKGIPTRDDVQRPAQHGHCLQHMIDTSMPMEASCSTSPTTMRAGADDSCSVSVLVDATGTGDKFVSAKVTKNGDAAPTSIGSDEVTLQLPAGTHCTGGKAKNLCLLSVKSTAGFGGCTVVSQLASLSGSTGTGSGVTSASAP
ncbi:hypothetical protein GGX14DRAFT_582667, partial [Mycena pura]